MSSCLREISAWSPALDAIEYNYRSLFDESIQYGGLPSPEIDANWDDLVAERPFALTEVEVTDKLRHSATKAVHFTEEEGGEYLGFLEVFHQLHCINMLRKFVYSDYYASDRALLDTLDNVRMHMDHCLEMLRRNVMCYGDVSVLTYTWSAKKDIPNPNFDVMHKCRNFDRIVDWNRNGERALNRTPTKPV
ncbi:hypothetical protein CLAIMM_09821 [Cladophialophora immunda]|nr:hypothetical protein CLAIMM_09821 [Cladophialophora immunda]